MKIMKERTRVDMSHFHRSLVCGKPRMACFMKKIISIIFAVALLVTGLTACNENSNNTEPDITNEQQLQTQNGGETQEEEEPEATEKLNIVNMIFPSYDWTREIIGDNTDNFELTYLLDNSVDTHSYQPSASDIIKISESDLFIYVGGHSDEGWVDDALEQSANPDMIVINLVEALGDRVLWTDHDCDAEEDDECEDHDELEEEEHVWVSLKNAEVLTAAIADVIIELDPDNADEYTANLEAYTEKLRELDEKYQEAVDTSEVKTLLFADRFPFLYLTKDYGLEHFAAFSGCSAETEASFEVIVFLAIKLDELNLKSVMVIDGSDKSIAETVINTAETGGQQILVLDSIKSVTANDVNNGTTYLSIMESNLEVLKEALK